MLRLPGVARAAISAALLLACNSSDTAQRSPLMDSAPNSPAQPGTGGTPAASAAEPVGTEPAAPSPSSGGSEAVTIGGLAPLPMGSPEGPGTGGATEPPPVVPASVVPGTEHYDCSPPSGTLPPLQLVPYVTGLDNPIFITHAPGETDRLFVLEQTGTIQVIRDGALGAAPFLDLTSRVVREPRQLGRRWRLCATRSHRHDLSPRSRVSHVLAGLSWRWRT
jgi:hypothetical protein